MTQPYIDTPKACEDCGWPIKLPRHAKAKRCAACQRAHLHARAKVCRAARYKTLKAAGRWATCSIDGCETDSKSACGKLCSAHIDRRRRGGDMAAPIGRALSLKLSHSVRRVHRRAVVVEPEPAPRVKTIRSWHSITVIRKPPNAPITIKGGWMRSKKGKLFYIKGKGSDNPLIDTGFLKMSVVHRVT